MAPKLLISVTLLLGGVEMFLFSGLIYGWVPLEYVLVEEGLFASYCVENSSSVSEKDANVTRSQNGATGNWSGVEERNQRGSDVTGGDATINHAETRCPEQKEWLNLVYTIATFGTNFLLPFVGFVYDKVGTCWTRIISLYVFFLFNTFTDF